MNVSATRVLSKLKKWLDRHGHWVFYSANRIELCGENPKLLSLHFCVLNWRPFVLSSSDKARYFPRSSRWRYFLARANKSAFGGRRKSFASKQALGPKLLSRSRTKKEEEEDEPSRKIQVRPPSKRRRLQAGERTVRRSRTNGSFFYLLRSGSFFGGQRNVEWLWLPGRKFSSRSLRSCRCRFRCVCLKRRNTCEVWV